MMRPNLPGKATHAREKLRGRTLCGQRLRNVRSTDAPEKVDCRACLKTLAWPRWRIRA
jgi:hypothetical protein